MSSYLGAIVRKNDKTEHGGYGQIRTIMARWRNA